jgi:PPOX class probable F420-dependent enzyme
LDPAEARRRLEAADVARLATVTPAGDPHLVPICFALLGDTLYSAVDDKPKASVALQRLANISARARATILADHYDTDWSQLWWARAEGDARRLADATVDEQVSAVAALRAKYPQYRDHRLDGAVLAVDITRWTGWAAAPGTGPAPER